MPVIRDTVIQFLQQIKGFGESARQTREHGATMPRLPLTPGTEVLATVTGKLENGMSLVRISSGTFAMDLPPGARTGDILRMTFLNQDPRPMFSLSNRTFSAAPVTMSPAGELVRRLLRNPSRDSSARSPLPVMGRLLDAPPGDTTRLAGRLRQALGESGLFYESHLEEWASGERPMARVMREPQAALSRPEARARAAAMTATERPSAGAAVQDGEMSGVPPEEGVAEEIPRPPGGSRSSETGPKETGRTPVETERREGAPARRDEGGRSAREAAPERREAPGGPAGEPGRRVPGEGSPDTGTGMKTPAPSAEQGDRLPKEAAPGPDSPLTKRQPTDSGTGTRPAEAPAKETGRTPVEAERREGAPAWRDEGGRTARDIGPERREAPSGPAGETGRRVPGEGFPDSGTGTKTPSPSPEQGDRLPKEAASGPDSPLTKRQPTDSGSGARPAGAPAKETGRTPVETERWEGASARRDEGGRSAREIAPERREAPSGPAGETGRRVPGEGAPDTGTGMKTPAPSPEQGDRLPKEAAPGPDSPLAKRQPTDSGAGTRSAEAPAKETGRTPVETERRESAPARGDEGGRSARDIGPERREAPSGPAGETGRSFPGERPTTPSPVREPAPEVRGESGKTVMAEAETGLRSGGPDPGRTPAALVEQRERLLKETYGRMEDNAIPEKQTPREPARGPLPGSERAPEFSRPVLPGQDRDVGAEVPRNVAAGDLARLEEHEPAELPPSRIAGQGEIADARTLPLVSRQLNMLNTGLFVWQGEAWPGQTMDWEVEDREANPETGDENGWRTTLRLDLPNLGRVTGVINLSGNELRLSLATDSPESASLMDVGLVELRERMGNAGIEVKGVAVRHEELEGT